MYCGGGSGVVVEVIFCKFSIPPEIFFEYGTNATGHNLCEHIYSELSTQWVERWAFGRGKWGVKPPAAISELGQFCSSYFAPVFWKRN